MSTQTWVLIGLGVGGFIWYENQKQKIPLAGNAAAKKVIDQAGTSASKLIDEGASALGSFLHRLGGGGSSAASSSSASFRPDDTIVSSDVEGYVGYDPTVGITDMGT